jgi:PAS domain S-box-containing protein
MSIRSKVNLFIALTLFSLFMLVAFSSGYVLLQSITLVAEPNNSLLGYTYQSFGSNMIMIADSVGNIVLEGVDAVHRMDKIKINQQSILVSLTVMGLAIIALGLSVFQKSVLRRLSKLVEQLSYIGKVDKLSERIDVQGQDEVARLGKAINHMLDDLQISQKAQAESEEKYRHLVEQSTQVTYIDAIDDTSTSLYYSPQVEKMLGYTLEEWLSNPNKWMETLHPDDRDRVKAYHLHSNETGEAFHTEYRLIARDRRVVWVLDDAVIIRNHEETLYWQGVLQDITEHKHVEETERRQRDFAEALRQTGVVLNTNLDMNAVLDLLLEEIGRVVPYDTGCVMLVNSDFAHIVRVRGFEKFGIDTKTGLQETGLDIRSYATFRQMFETGSPMVVADTQALPDWTSIAANPKARSWAGAPMISQGQLFGFISLDKIEAGFYQGEHADRLAIFAAQAALALQNARLFEVVQCHAEENRRLREASSVVTSALEMDQVLDSY